MLRNEVFLITLIVQRIWCLINMVCFLHKVILVVYSCNHFWFENGDIRR